MLKLTKTGIGLLTRQYRSVLKKCFLINAGLFFALAPSAADAEDWGYMTPSGTGNPGWGTFSDGSYIRYYQWRGPETSAIVIADKAGGPDFQMSMQIDGFFYQNEGNYRVLDQSDAISSVTSGSNKLVTSGAVYSAIDALDNNYYMNYRDSMTKSFIKAANDNRKSVIVMSAFKPSSYGKRSATIGSRPNQFAEILWSSHRMTGKESIKMTGNATTTKQAA